MIHHAREKVAVIRNISLGAVLVAADVYERLERATDIASAAPEPALSSGNTGNSSIALEFLTKNRSSAASQLTPKKIDGQIRDEREAWE